MKWFDRQFSFDQPLWLYPSVVERLRGTPARLEDRLGSLTGLTIRPGDAWSIQEHVGHLLDLEPLWFGRVEDILGGHSPMRAADLKNRKTHEAGHNDRSTGELLGDFRLERSRLVGWLDRLGEGEAALHSAHPRLNQPMRLLDLAFFVAEHDDHHLATISSIAKKY